MWILAVPQSEQYALAAHERWLRPGRQVKIGRHPDNDIALDGAKSVSKQHLELEISAQDSGASAAIEKRSSLVIRDLGSKFKTHLIHAENDAEKQIDGEHIFSGTSTNIRLGKASDTIFRVYWRDVVLTLSNIKPKDVQEACDALDIKYCKTYSDQTTHVVTNKYNTPKVLQALAMQKWIVGVQYVQCMFGRINDLGQNISAMPDPKDTTLLPTDAFSEEFGHAIFLPKASRERCFAGLTFVFFTPEQHKSLDAPIQAGSGKSMLYSGQLDASAITNHVQTIKHPVIIPPVNDEALTEILDGIVLTIQCATMTQGDFIRVILSDGKHEIYTAKMLSIAQVRARLEPVENVCPPPVRIPEQDGQSQSAEVSQHDNDNTSSHNAEEPKKRRIGGRRVKALASFEDDLFGGAAASQSQPKAETQKEMPTNGRRTLQSRALTGSVDLFDSAFPLPSSQATTLQPKTNDSQGVSTPRATRKRQLLDDDDDDFTGTGPDTDSFKRSRRQTSTQAQCAREDEEEFEVAPAAAAFEKTRSQAKRLQQDTDIVQHSETDSEQAVHRANSAAKRKRSETADETEEQIQETLRANMKRAEAQTQAHQKDDNLADGEDLRNLGTVEYFRFELPQRDHATERSRSDATNTASSRWDPRWNGRKNFKKFRRATKGGHNRDRADSTRPAIMIRLVESKPSNRALLDKQWLETATIRDSPAAERTPASRIRNPAMPPTTNSSRSRASQSLFMPVDSDSDDDPLKFRM